MYFGVRFCSVLQFVSRCAAPSRTTTNAFSLSLFSFSRPCKGHGLRSSPGIHIDFIRTMSIQHDPTYIPGIVYTTTGSMEDAQSLARKLVQSRHAGCVQLKDVTSVYAWQGNIEEDKEVGCESASGFCLFLLLLLFFCV